MSGDFIEVTNLIHDITRIYSVAYKPFFKIAPERYINVDDLIQDLIYRIPYWDGHASLNARNSLQDASSYRINSYGNAYIYVSRNTKIDTIYRFYDEITAKGVKEITINLISINDRTKYNQLLCFILMPFVSNDLEVISTSPKSPNGVKPNFTFDAKTRVAQLFIYLLRQNKTFEVKKFIPDVKVNLLFNDLIAPMWYQRLTGEKMTIYSYSDCTTCKGYIEFHRGVATSNFCTIMMFTKYIASTKEKSIINVIKNLPVHLRPMS